MANPKVSVVVPTRDRQSRLVATVTGLAEQRDFDPGDYEVIVVDDGSSPPATTPVSADTSIDLIRLEGEGRSAARNRGARAGSGELIVFVDDDMQVATGFLAAHWQAHLDWPGSLQVGAVRLPESALRTPFGRFRQRLEDEGVPEEGGRTTEGNFATAQNMAIEKTLFERLGGFDPDLSVAEDQDLALRHSDLGGGIVFVPAAQAVHDDHDALDIETYCERAERYMAELVRFGARHPGLPDTIDRARVNGPARWGREPAALSTKKALKRAVLWRPSRGVILQIVSRLEQRDSEGPLLERLYRLLLGAHLQRGYRRGLRAARE